MHRLGAVALLVSIGCADRQSPTQPTAATAAPALQEFRLSGSVMDTAGRPLSESSVEVIAGTRAGTIATTDDRGRYRMPGMFTGVVSLRASRDGYAPQATTLPIHPLPTPTPPWELTLDYPFSLQPDGPSADIAGTFTLEVTADSACTSLPDEARRRVYTATVVRGSRSTTFNGTLAGARLVPVERWSPFFEINVAGDFASLHLSVAERLGEQSYLSIEGSASATTTLSGMTAPFNAQILHCPSTPAYTGEYWQCVAEPGDDCATVAHQVALIRR
jgi:hypothetical protein